MRRCRLLDVYELLVEPQGWLIFQAAAVAVRLTVAPMARAT
ncbi:MAG TPA: hypothetical protein VM684_14520 [Gaiellales bacterium]|nr:hypothetical protein [Gaiellales bacterium]